MSNTTTTLATEKTTAANGTTITLHNTTVTLTSAATNATETSTVIVTSNTKSEVTTTSISTTTTGESSVGAIAGGAAGGVVCVVIVIVLVLIFWLRRRRKKREAKRANKPCAPGKDDISKIEMGRRPKNDYTPPPCNENKSSYYANINKDGELIETNDPSLDAMGYIQPKPTQQRDPGNELYYEPQPNKKEHKNKKQKKDKHNKKKAKQPVYENTSEPSDSKHLTGSAQETSKDHTGNRNKNDIIEEEYINTDNKVNESKCDKDSDQTKKGKSPLNKNKNLKADHDKKVKAKKDNNIEDASDKIAANTEEIDEEYEIPDTSACSEPKTLHVNGAKNKTKEKDMKDKTKSKGKKERTTEEGVNKEQWKGNSIEEPTDKITANSAEMDEEYEIPDPQPKQLPAKSHANGAKNKANKTKEKGMKDKTKSKGKKEMTSEKDVNKEKEKSSKNKYENIQGSEKYVNVGKTNEPVAEEYYEIPQND